jgi:hypothetical protein
MAVLISCPACGRRLQNPEVTLGQRVSCPACAATFTPAAPVAVSAGEVLDPAAGEKTFSTTETHLHSETVPTEVNASRPRRRSRSWLRVAVGLTVFLSVLFGGVGYWAWTLAGREIPEAEWEKFAPVNGRFTVRMPGAPVPTVARVEGWTFRQYRLIREREEVEFIVGYHDVPPAPVQPSLLDEAVALVRDDRLRELSGTLIAEQEVTGEDYPCREIHIDSTSRHVTYMGRVFVAGPRVFVVEVFGHHVRPGKGAAATFFDSFKIDVPSSNGPKRGFARGAFLEGCSNEA